MSFMDDPIPSLCTGAVMLSSVESMKLKLVTPTIVRPRTHTASLVGTSMATESMAVIGQVYKCFKHTL